MKVVRRLLLVVATAVAAISMLNINSFVYADPSRSSGFAEYDDQTADEISKTEQETQEKEIKENAQKSNDNYLSELSINGYELIPQFDRQTVNYEISVEPSVNEIEVNAKADDEKATINGTGKIILNSGENDIQINVNAENSSVRTYYVKVKKEVLKETCKLSKLGLKYTDKDNKDYDINITPEFNSEVYVYNCEVLNDVTKLNIDAQADNANITVSGNDNLKVGNNEIIITVTSKDDAQNKSIYKITVNKKEHVEVKDDSNSNGKYVAMGICLGTGILCCIFAVKRNTKKNSRRKH